MRRRLRPEAWILIVISAVGVLIGADALMRALRAERGLANPAAERAKRDAAMARLKKNEITVRTGLYKDTLAPDFELPDKSGRKRKLSEFAGKPALLAFYCGCARCGLMAQLISEIEGTLTRKQPRNIAVVTMERASLDSWARRAGFKGTLLLEAKQGPVMAQYSGHPCPRVYLLGPDQRIRHVTPSPENLLGPAAVMDPLAAAMGSSWRYETRDPLATPG